MLLVHGYQWSQTEVAELLDITSRQLENTCGAVSTVSARNWRFTMYTEVTEQISALTGRLDHG